MPSSNQLSSNQLRQALQLREQIDSLEEQLGAILGGGGEGGAQVSGGGKAAPTTAVISSAGSSVSSAGRKRSAATLRKMRAAQQARWAKIRGENGESPAKANGTAKPDGAAKTTGAQSKPGGTGRNLTPEGRARIAAAMKARWAARKKGAPAPNAKAKAMIHT